MKMNKMVSILSAVILVLGGGLMLLRPNTVVASKFAWLDWDANPPFDNVLYYTLYIGKDPAPMSKIELGNQTSIQVIRNHRDIYAAVTATNSVGESPRSNEVHIVSP